VLGENARRRPLLPGSMQDFGMSSFEQFKESNRHLAFNKENCDVALDLTLPLWPPGRRRVKSG
jgi:hypothetical protein